MTWYLLLIGWLYHWSCNKSWEISAAITVLEIKSYSTVTIFIVVIANLIIIVDIMNNNDDDDDAIISTTVDRKIIGILTELYKS